MRKKLTQILLLIVGIFLFGLVLGILVLIPYARSVAVADPQRTAWLKNNLIAHRGLHGGNPSIPENSMPAFKAALLKGCPIEFDVSLTKDNRLVVFHDKKLKRLLGVDAYLNQVSYSELTRFTFPNSSETVPSLHAVLYLVNGKVPLLIEIKNEGEIGGLESMLYAELKQYPGQFAVQSFNPYAVKWFREHAPEVLRGQLSGSFIVSDYDIDCAGTTRLPWYKRFILSRLLLNFESQPQFIAYEVKHTEESMRKTLRQLAVPVIGWSIDTKEEYLSMKNDFDNFIVNTMDVQ